MVTPWDVAWQLLRDRGWLTIPVDAATKRPLVEWKDYIDGPWDEEALERAWDGHGGATGLALLTGPRSLVAVDADTEEAADFLLDKLDGAHVPAFSSPRGFKLLYAHPGGEVPSSSSRIHPGVDLCADSHIVIIPPSEGREWWGGCSLNDVDLPPLPEWARVKGKPGARRGTVSLADTTPIADGRRHTELVRIGGALVAKGLGHREVVTVLDAVNQTRCKPPLDTDEIRVMVKSLEGYRPPAESDSGERGFEAAGGATWPVLGEAALYGLAGEVVRTIEPHTEADPVALLVEFLTSFGSCVGPGPFAMADGGQHPARLFAVLVGETSTSRKGTAHRRIKPICVAVDPMWKSRVLGGLSTGEGLVYAVRDPADDDDPTDVGDPKKPSDEGVKDKRLHDVEPEFARVLVVASREGNTLSMILRDAWDDGDLHVMTRRQPLHATGAYISMVGHCTLEELRKRLTQLEAANGFANRFLFVLVRRSRLLPRGSELPNKAFTRLIRFTRKAVEGARAAGKMDFSPDAGELWDELYGVIAKENRGGLFGAMTARGDAHLLRLSVTYALLDGSSTIEVPHLEAAWAVWRYVRDSVRLIFGDSSGNDVEDRLLVAIVAAGESGLVEAAQFRIFDGHVSKEDLRAARKSLVDKGAISITPISTGGRQRRTARVRASKAKEASKGPTVVPSDLTSEGGDDE